MTQTTLFPVEKKILKELWSHNSHARTIICDVALAEKMKKLTKLKGGNQ